MNKFCSVFVFSENSTFLFYFLLLCLFLKGAFVGSHKGDCNFYNISGITLLRWYILLIHVTLVSGLHSCPSFFIFSDNKLQEKIQVNLKNKKNKLHMKRITGFQVLPLFSYLFSFILFF